MRRELWPRGPYSLALSARGIGDATRRRDERGVVTGAVWSGSSPSLFAAWQRPDGSVVVRARDDETVERARFALALADDHTEFLRRFAGDPLLGLATRRLRGLRPVRVDTVAQALLRAFCGQLIDAGTARRLEARIIRASCPAVADGLRAPPTAQGLGRLSAAALRGLGLHARRAAALVRVCRSLELERLRDVPTATVAERIGRERGLGPWSVGVVCIEGLGRSDFGLVGDLGLVKLMAALRGRWVEGWETAELLEPYGEWAGLASVYLLTAYDAGLVPIAVANPRSAARPFASRPGEPLRRRGWAPDVAADGPLDEARPEAVRSALHRLPAT